MQKQYDERSGFNGWYETKRDEMKEDPTMRFLIRARNFSTKEAS
jgi:hypothetical protein